MWLPWQDAVWLAIALAVLATGLWLAGVRAETGALAGAGGLAGARLRRWLWLQQLSQEGAIFAILYATWQRVGALSSGDTSHAIDRGRWIAKLEHDLFMPGEASAQHLVLHSHLVVEFANWYYIVGHAPAMGIFLVWLYVRHRTDFARWRTALAVGCIVGELIQIIPVAPPRLALSSMVDTAAVFGPRVYSADGEGFAPQLAAFPSLHCVWAITIGASVFFVAKSRWRWIGPAHALLTVLVVVVTGNHFWLDAAAGGALVLLGLGVHSTITYAWRRARRPAATLRPLPEPDLVAAEPGSSAG